ncbi:hypothetical protein MES5069_220213 [Mesorhizobium escarrei]|uniref:Uncharacterized protein n=1 Tax=Mesorhizobium escarrei TaxID=666018 RepID=A0ABN8JS75_9HYPH|nr:hypothetical protein MES5069_220213 [Mesorhizobium escarrei]
MLLPEGLYFATLPGFATATTLRQAETRDDRVIWPALSFARRVTTLGKAYRGQTAVRLGC